MNTIQLKFKILGLIINNKQVLCLILLNFQSKRLETDARKNAYVNSKSRLQKAKCTSFTTPIDTN